MLESPELIFLAVVVVIIGLVIRRAIGANKKDIPVRRATRAPATRDVWNSAATRRRNAP